MEKVIKQDRFVTLMTPFLNFKICKIKEKIYWTNKHKNDIELTINDIAKKIIILTKSNSKLIYKKLPMDDPLQRLPDISVARSIRLESKVNLETGLMNTIKYFSSIKTNYLIKINHYFCEIA